MAAVLPLVAVMEMAVMPGVDPSGVVLMVRGACQDTRRGEWDEDGAERHEQRQSTHELPPVRERDQAALPGERAPRPGGPAAAHAPGDGRGSGRRVVGPAAQPTAEP
jgi:hypothetical protein